MAQEKDEPLFIRVAESASAQDVAHEIVDATMGAFSNATGSVPVSDAKFYEIRDFFKSVMTTLGTGAEGISSAVSQLPGTVKKATIQLCNAIKKGADSIWEGIKDGSARLYDTIKAVFGNALKLLGEVLNAIAPVISSGKDIINRAAEIVVAHSVSVLHSVGNSRVVKAAKKVVRVVGKFTKKEANRSSARPRLLKPPKSL